MIIFKKALVLGLIGVSALALSACNKTSSTGGTVTNTSQENSTPASNDTESGEEVTITFSDSGVTPAQAEVKSGGTINWVNNSSKVVEVGSDPHPTHTVNTEISAGEFVIDLAPGASSKAKVIMSGTFGYHDHLKPSVRGKVVVK